MTNDALERELSRVLHELPGEPPEHPGRLPEVRARATRLRRQHRTGAAVALAAVTAVIVLVPTLLFGGGGSAVKQAPVVSPSDWPSRGSLADDTTVQPRAVAAWQRALTSRHRGRLTQPAHLVYAGQVPHVGVVVVLSGVEPRGGDRIVIAVGEDTHHLSLFADEAQPFGVSPITVLFGAPQQIFEGPSPSCRTQPTGQPASRALLVIGPPDTTGARWHAQQLRTPPCGGDVSGPWHNLALHDGVGATQVVQPFGQEIQAEVDADSGGYTGRPIIDGPVPVVTLGQRVARGVPIVPLGSVATTTTRTSSSVSTRAGISGSKSDNGNPFGWARRSDASNAQAAFDPMQVFASVSDPVESVPIVYLALPDGTFVNVAAARAGTHDEQAYLSVTTSGRDSVRTYVRKSFADNRPPYQLSAIIQGRTERWLFVAGTPGIYRIMWRPVGTSLWRQMPVYESTGTVRITDAETKPLEITLWKRDGSVIYEGPVDSTHPLR